jgi:hypothetical protein
LRRLQRFGSPQSVLFLAPLFRSYFHFASFLSAEHNTLTAAP